MIECSDFSLEDNQYKFLQPANAIMRCATCRYFCASRDGSDIIVSCTEGHDCNVYLCGDRRMGELRG